MKKQLKSLLAGAMAMCSFLSLTACGDSGKDASSTPTSTVMHEEKVQFPLEEPVTFKFMLRGLEEADFKEKLANNALWKKVKEETNVNIEFQFLGSGTAAAEKLALMINGDNYGDVWFGGPWLTDLDVSKYIEAGKLQEIGGYFNETAMPNFTKDLKERPSIYNMVTAADGKIYTLPKINGLEGNYLESPIWINKKWLDNLNMEIPTTLDELTDVLRAFATKDPNNNGLEDEIPYLCASSHSFMHTEALLGLWGLATKDSTTDSFVQVVDGKVKFVPIDPAYKEAVKWFRTLYTEGLMWNECFTANSSTTNAKLTSETCVVGMFTNTAPVTTAYSSDYVCIPPPKVEGYEAKWYYHPAIDGSKNQFLVTDLCKNVDILMAFMDKFYDLENALACNYGFAGEGRLEKTDDGKYKILTLDAENASKLDKENPTLIKIIGNIPFGVPVSAYQNQIELGGTDAIKQNNYQIYKDYINDEIWPRPYYAPDDAYDMDALTTDIFYQVDTKRASWITNKSDIDKEWDAYVNTIKGLGIDNYLEILQRSYDVYANAKNENAG